MRHIGEIENASVAAPWPPTALPDVSLSTSSSGGVGRPALQLPRASKRPVGPSGGRKRFDSGCGQPHGDPLQRDRHARHHSLHLPRLRLRPRHQPSWDGFAPSWAIWGSPPPMPSVCGGAVDSAVSSARERVRICDVGKRGGASGYGDGAGSIELGREGNGRPLTHVWRVENSSAGSSFSSPCVWMLPVAVHFRARFTNGMEATSNTRAVDSAMGIDQRQGERERLGWCR